MARKDRICFSCGKICQGYQCMECRKKRKGSRVSQIKRREKDDK